MGKEQKRQKTREELQVEFGRLNRELGFNPPLAIPDKAEIARRKKAVRRLEKESEKLGGPFPPGTSVRLIREARREAERRAERSIGKK